MGLIWLLELQARPQATENQLPQGHPGCPTIYHMASMQALTAPGQHESGSAATSRALLGGTSMAAVSASIGTRPQICGSAPLKFEESAMSMGRKFKC
mmetsp:Transcript_29980/g.54306  ORF Transcript_29980/g.54306 Transcript_29980/m.54306 type:complete len:97 (-) Transcript_29980:1019-1309(-)